MPRPDKRFIRYPRQGPPPPEPEAEETPADPDAPEPTFVKGRHMVVPRPSDPSKPIAKAQPTPGAAAPPTGERVSKYEGRPTSGPVRTPSDPPAETPEPAVEPAASAEPTEVVFDLRESEGGFEGTYWKEPPKKKVADDSG